MSDGKPEKEVAEDRVDETPDGGAADEVGSSRREATFEDAWQG